MYTGIMYLRIPVLLYVYRYPWAHTTSQHGGMLRLLLALSLSRLPYKRIYILYSSFQ